MTTPTEPGTPEAAGPPPPPPSPSPSSRVSVRTDYLIAGAIVLVVVVFLGRAILSDPDDPSAAPPGSSGTAAQPASQAVSQLTSEQQAEYGERTAAGLSAYGQQNFTEAEAAFRRTLEIAPEDPVANNNVGSVLNAQGKFDEAIPLLQKAVQLDPGFALARNNLAYSLSEKGKAGGFSNVR